MFVFACLVSISKSVSVITDLHLAVVVCQRLSHVRMNDSLLDFLPSLNLQWIRLRLDKAQQRDLMESVRDTESVYCTSATLSNSSLLNSTWLCPMFLTSSAIIRPTP
jgi:hypothetical protein